jgi:SPP1 family phage portal protein
MAGKRKGTEEQTVANNLVTDTVVKPEKTTKLVDYITNKPTAAFISSELSKFRASAEYKDMTEGLNYYKLKCDIEKKERKVQGCKGQQAVDDGTLANTKLKHAFLYKQVRQKISYLLSKPWSIRMDEKNKGLQEILEQNYFTPKFRNSLKKSATDSIVEGKSWIQPYIDDDGRVKFKFVKGCKVKVYWADDEREEVKAVMKIYDTIEVGEDGKTYEVTNVEFYNQKGCYVFTVEGNGNKVKENGKQTSEDEDGNFVPYFSYREAIMKKNEDGSIATDENGKPIQETVEDEEGNQVPLFSEEKIGTFGAVPFIPIKYNEEEIPLLKFIKDKNDNYDEISSAVADFIIDVPSSIKVVKGYTGTKVGQFVRNLATYRVIFVDADGAVENLQSSMDATTVENHLDRLREDIYADGSCVDSTKTDSLGALSGTALKYLYQDLDIDVRNLWNSIDNALHQIYQYICMDLESQGLGSFYDEHIEFIPNTDGIMNETEVIQALTTSAGILSKKTILANHPYVTDVQAELDEKEKEDKATLERYNNYAFGKNNGGGNNPVEDKTQEQETNPDDEEEDED